MENKSIIEEVKENICEECKGCVVYAKDENGKKYRINANYCNNGSGYIELDLYDDKGDYLETCKLKDFTDSCDLPFKLVVDSEPDCGCL
ncbi:hypothetical protein IMCC3317_40840 [Kordia antarctica]|uniref:Uncharacterized protein n=1 Tax=Kordia antarctica TaxID=1218801 RepID=A0A7L4ZQA7_9FLAO|nr:hypothetical protein [Kordia antarctica]QHI38690.1 hypothetical protein IMCC3317_40840 [Kordia antarctica]